MKFIVLIIALAALQYWGSGRPVQRDGWFRGFAALLADRGMPPALELSLAVGLPCLALLWMLDILGNALFAVPAFLIMLATLLYSFGRGDFTDVVNKYREHCRAGDFEGAYLYVREELQEPGELEIHDGARPAVETEALHRFMKSRILYRGFERWFAVIFYFVLFGVVGALAYRLLQLMGTYSEDEETGNLQRRVLYWVDWLPSRLLVFAFALTGDWVASREQLVGAMADTRSATPQVLTDAAHTSLGLKSTVFSESRDITLFAKISDWEVAQLHDLLRRSAVGWVVVLALVVLLT